MYVYYDTINAIGKVFSLTFSKVRFVLEDGTKVTLTARKGLGIREVKSLVFMEDSWN